MNQNPVKSIKGGVMVRQLTFKISSARIFEDKDLESIKELPKTAGLNDYWSLQQDGSLTINIGQRDINYEALFNVCESLSLQRRIFLTVSKKPHLWHEIGHWQGGKNTWGINRKAIMQRLVDQELIDS